MTKVFATDLIARLLAASALLAACATQARPRVGQSSRTSVSQERKVNQRSSLDYSVALRAKLHAMRTDCEAAALAKKEAEDSANAHRELAHKYYELRAPGCRGEEAAAQENRRRLELRDQERQEALERLQVEVIEEWNTEVTIREAAKKAQAAEALRTKLQLHIEEQAARRERQRQDLRDQFERQKAVTESARTKLRLQIKERCAALKPEYALLPARCASLEETTYLKREEKVACLQHYESVYRRVVVHDFRNQYDAMTILTPCANEACSDEIQECRTYHEKERLALEKKHGAADAHKRLLTQLEQERRKFRARRVVCSVKEGIEDTGRLAREHRRMARRATRLLERRAYQQMASNTLSNRAFLMQSLPSLQRDFRLRWNRRLRRGDCRAQESQDVNLKSVRGRTESQ